MKPDTPSPSLTRHAGSPMSRATPEMRDFAERVIAYETREKISSGTTTPVAFQVCEKLGPHLANLMGKIGYWALLTRAHLLAEEEAPCLHAVQVTADGTLGGLDEPEVHVEPEKLAEGGVVLVAQLLGLLEAFIGQKLTLRMLHDVWPKLTLSELYFRNDPQP